MKYCFVSICYNFLLSSPRGVEVVDAEVDGCMQGLDMACFVKRFAVKLRHSHASGADAADLEGAVAKGFGEICHGSIFCGDRRFRVPIGLERMYKAVHSE